MRFSNLVEVIEFCDQSAMSSPGKDITPPQCKTGNSFVVKTMRERIEEAKAKN